MTAAMIAARKCVAWIASEEELGDLEEVGHSVSGRVYLREAAAICLSVLYRRLRRAITQGGVEMARIILWAALSVAGVFAFLLVGGGAVSVYIQPFEWGVILAAMLGFAAAGGRLGAWPGILRDLRRAHRMSKASWLKRRTAYLREQGDFADFSHLAGIFAIAKQATPADADRLMSGGVALFREKSRQRIAVVEQTVRDAYAGSFIAMIFGVIHTLGNLDESMETIGHLLSGAACASFFGVILARAVLAPIASQLEAFYEQQAREMEALRLSIGGEEPVETFEVLAACWS
jgi:flagellar motor component MotA